MEGAVAAVDGERDPRCLLLGFQSIWELCCLYAEHDPEVSAADASLCFCQGHDSEAIFARMQNAAPCISIRLQAPSTGVFYLLVALPATK